MLVICTKFIVGVEKLLSALCIGRCVCRINVPPPPPICAQGSFIVPGCECWKCTQSSVLSASSWEGTLQLQGALWIMPEISQWNESSSFTSTLGRITGFGGWTWRVFYISWTPSLTPELLLQYPLRQCFFKYFGTLGPLTKIFSCIEMTQNVD